MTVSLNINISTSAKTLVKGDRVVVKESKDKWFLGTVTGVRLTVPTVLLDNGTKVRVELPRNIKPTTSKRVRKSSLTDVQAKELYTLLKLIKPATKLEIVPATVNSPVRLEAQQVDRTPRQQRIKERKVVEQDRNFFLRVSDWARDHKFEMRKPQANAAYENITVFNSLYLIYFVKTKDDSCLVRIYPNSKDNTTLKFIPFVKLKDKHSFDVVTEALQSIQNNDRAEKIPTLTIAARLKLVDKFKALVKAKGATVYDNPQVDDGTSVVIRSKSTNRLGVGDAAQASILEMDLTTKFDSPTLTYTAITKEGKEAFTYTVRRY